MVLPGTIFRVALANDHLVLAHVSGKIRKRFIRLTIGDRVKMEMNVAVRHRQGAYRLSTVIYGNEILVRSAATTQTESRSKPQKLAGALSFNVEADRYREDDRRRKLGNSQTENTKVNLYPLRQRSYLDKERRYSGPADIKELVIPIFSP